MKRYVTLLCLLALRLLAAAQFGDVTITPLRYSDRLPVDEVTQVFQDGDGYVWYGTADGLCRDDGYGIHVFRKDVFHPERTDVNEVTAIGEDRSGHLWIGTSTGLIRMDHTTYDMVHVGDDELLHARIEYMLTATDGTVWAMGTERLYHIGADGTVIHTYDMPEGITCLYEDSHGNVFVSRFGHGLMVLRGGAGSEERDFELVAPWYQISAMMEDTLHHCYWLCDRNMGFVKYTEGTDPQYPYLEHQPTVTDDYGKPVTFFTHTVQDDRYGYIWAISYYRGLYVFRTSEDGHLERLSTASFMPQNNYIYYSIFKSRTGNLWVTGFDTGSFIIDLGKKRVHHNPLQQLATLTHFSPSVVSLYRDESRMFWVMQKRNNLWLYNAATDEWADYMKQPDILPYRLYLTNRLIPSHTADHVWAITSDEALLLTHSGMRFVVKDHIHIHTIEPEPGRITSAYEDRLGRLWLGTTDCLIRMEDGHGTVVCDSGEVSDIKEDVAGNLWCTIRNVGLLKVDAGGGTHLFPLDLDLLTLACIDRSVWVGTREGRIYQFDETQPDGQKFSDYTEECGMNGDRISGLAADCFGHLWVMTNQQLKEYDPESGASVTMSTYDPWCPLSRLLPASMFVDPVDHQIYVGGIPGFMAITPSKNIESQTGRAMPHITDVVVAGTSVWFDSPHRTTPTEVTLDADAHNIVISFSTLNFSGRRGIRYAYRMDGVDNEWTTLDAGHNTAVYNRLPRGRHLFRVRSTDGSGLWNETETTLTVYRTPAWYETTVAYIIYILLTLLAILAVISLYKQYLKRQSQKELNDNITQAKMVYFTSISHELLTPLTIINLLAQRLHTDETTDDAPRLIQANVSRLRRLLQQVLDFRKVESHNMKLLVEPLNITEFLRTICRESFEPLAQNKHIEFLTLLPARDIEGYADCDKLEKILFNLVSNAFKYTPDGRKVTLSATSAAGMLTLSVSDEGVGIDQREQKFIFNRFYSSRKNDNSISNGIGLSLTKELVELHHGTISVTSQVNKGSEFKVEIPIDRGSFDETEIRTRDEGIQPQGGSKDIHAEGTKDEGRDTKDESQGMSLLMVEDNLELLSTMQDVLSEHFKVFVARDGIEALEVMAAEDISVVVSDISMPRMDGIELCRRVKGDVSISHTIFVLLTAMVSTQSQVDAYGAGADAYLAKPFDTPVLLSLLNNLTTSRQKLQQQVQQAMMQATTDDLDVNDLDREFVQRAIHLVEKHIADSDYDVEALCGDMTMSRSTLTRKLKALTGQTPLQFIRSIRMKYAYQLLQNHTVSVAEAMYRVGYNDQRSFTLAFKEMYGITPGAIEK